ncbi:MAG: LysR family transcriptional regulator [Oscillospiraceae bacterium]|nr:LysR family transcriptional regulator [Oscillospiraceae bacterium]
MKGNLDLYRIFCAVVRAGTFSGAARELYVTQPAVSQAVQQLEQRLDAKLFVRGARGVTLTPEGELLYSYARSALNLLTAGEGRVSQLDSLDAGELRIGAGDTVTKWFLLPVIEEFHRSYPDVALRITNRTSRETVQLLEEGRIDIGFVNLPLSAPGVVTEPCCPIHDVFIAGPAYDDLRGRTVGLAELAEQSLILLEQTSNSRRWIDRHFLSAGVALQPAIELGAHDLLADCARIGLGVACVIEEFSRSVIGADGVFRVEVDPPVPRRSVGACYLESVGLSPAARRFLTLAGSRSTGKDA